MRPAGTGFVVSRARQLQEVHLNQPSHVWECYARILVALHRSGRLGKGPMVLHLVAVGTDREGGSPAWPRHSCHGSFLGDFRSIL
jgi:hypothetical protein